MFLLGGCPVFIPEPAAKTAFLQRAESETQGGVTVTVAVPDDKEDRDFFGVNLAKHDIQPVWLHIENHDASDCLLRAGGSRRELFFAGGGGVEISFRRFRKGPEGHAE